MPVSNIVLARTKDLWWRVEESARLTDLQLSKRARYALYRAGVYRASEVRDLDLDRFANLRGLGSGCDDARQHGDPWLGSQPGGPLAPRRSGRPCWGRG